MGNRKSVKDFGTCINFTGAEESFAEVASNAITAFNGLSSISFRVKLKTLPVSDKPIIDNQWGTGNNVGGWQVLVKSTGVIDLYVGDATNRDVLNSAHKVNSMQASLPVGIWKTCVITKNNTTHTQKLYVDGVLEASRSNCLYGTTQPSGVVMRFGGNRTGGSEVSCYMDEIEIYDQELSATDALDIYLNKTISKTPIHRWLFDEGSGTSALDSIGGATATITGATYSTDVICKPRTLI